jgi:hypothetical protein
MKKANILALAVAGACVAAVRPHEAGARLRAAGTGDAEGFVQ